MVAAAASGGMAGWARTISTFPMERGRPTTRPSCMPSYPLSPESDCRLPQRMKRDGFYQESNQLLCEILPLYGSVCLPRKAKVGRVSALSRHSMGCGMPQWGRIQARLEGTRVPWFAPGVGYATQCRKKPRCRGGFRVRVRRGARTRLGRAQLIRLNVWRPSR